MNIEDWDEAARFEELYKSYEQHMSAQEFVKDVLNVPMSTPIKLFLIATESGVQVSWLKRRYTTPLYRALVDINTHRD